MGSDKYDEHELTSLAQSELLSLFDLPRIHGGRRYPKKSPPLTFDEQVKPHKVHRQNRGMSHHTPCVCLRRYYEHRGAYCPLEVYSVTPTCFKAGKRPRNVFGLYINDVCSCVFTDIMEADITCKSLKAFMIHPEQVNQQPRIYVIPEKVA